MGSNNAVTLKTIEQVYNTDSSRHLTHATIWCLCDRWGGCFGEVQRFIQGSAVFKPSHFPAPIPNIFYNPLQPYDFDFGVSSHGVRHPRWGLAPLLEHRYNLKCHLNTGIFLWSLFPFPLGSIICTAPPLGKKTWHEKPSLFPVSGPFENQAGRGRASHPQVSQQTI